MENEVYKKIQLRPLVIKGEQCYQAEQFTQNKVFHNNITVERLQSYVNDLVVKYNQVAILCQENTISFFRLPNGKIRTKNLTDIVRQPASLQHNRTKQYILQEGMAIPALVDLGVFDKDYHIVKSKYDKYKQINHYVEIVEHATKNIDKQNLTILDFGCGKSYLTFVLYYYFNVVRQKSVTIIGYDLKADVVEHCNKVAQKYGYQDNLHFVVGDVSKDVEQTTDIDMLVTLHACDRATDYALHYAITHKVPYIFSVPCCQHEVNLSIKKCSGDLDIMLNFGLIKERMSALLTDAIRAEILKQCGYDVDVVEFVDMEHSPKNIMIRANLTSLTKLNSVLSKQKGDTFDTLLQLADKYQFKQTLLQLLTK